jgi:putative NIF3 family GTP cyclohydrolase 1 type 2
MKPISRREFVALAAAGAVAAPLADGQRPPAGAPLTPHELIARIKQHVGLEWKSETVDGFKAGDPATAITGVATTAMATLDVLGRAVKARANLVITCEPTFYGRADSPTPPAGRGGPPPAATAAAAEAKPDPVFAAKDDFIRKNGLVVWRFADHWRARKPDPFVEGLLEALGFRPGEDPARTSIPPTPLDELVSNIRKKLSLRGGIRIVGDPQIRVSTVALLPGSTPIRASLVALPAADVVIAGEVREWESVEYARDTVTAGGRKGLILLGRAVSEDPGMNVCARWIKTLAPELTTTWLPVGDPYWRPL